MIREGDTVLVLADWRTQTGTVIWAGPALVAVRLTSGEQVTRYRHELIPPLVDEVTDLDATAATLPRWARWLSRNRVFLRCADVLAAAAERTPSFGHPWPSDRSRR